MSNAVDYYRYAALATAAYVRMGGKSLDGATFAEQAALPAQAGGRLPTAQAEKLFVKSSTNPDTWDVLSYYGGDIPANVDPNAAADKSGFAATLSERDGEKVLAIRGTESDKDGTVDVVSADAQIGLFGLAFTQVVSMANYVMRLKTSAGVFVPQLKVQATLDEPSSGTYLRAAREGGGFVYLKIEQGTPLAGLDLLKPGDAVRLTGHSLGGHLAYMAARLFPDVFDPNVVVFNAPGYDPTTENLRAFLDSFPLGITLGTKIPPGEIAEEIGDAAKQLAIVSNVLTDDALAKINVALGRSGSQGAPTVVSLRSEDLAPGDDRDVIASELTGADKYGTPIDLPMENNNHVIEPFEDALALQAAIDPIRGTTFGTSELTRVLQASANKNERSYEEFTEALARLFIKDAKFINESGNPSEHLPTSDESSFKFTGKGTIGARNAFHDAVLKLQPAIGGAPQPANLASIADVPASELTTRVEASNAFAYRYALKALNPFAVLGMDSLYTPHNGEGDLNLYSPAATPRGGMTTQYIADRVPMWGYANTVRTQDVSFLVDSSIAQSTLYEDRGTNLKFSVLRPGEDTNQARRVAFGADGTDGLTGTVRADQLYGAVGTDALEGKGGDDYLEGGRGLDLYLYGAQKVLGAPFNEGNDTILDVDGKGVLRYTFLDGTVAFGTRTSTVIVDASVKHLSGNLWFSADGRFQYEKSGSDLKITILGDAGGTILLKDFRDGDFGIRLFDPHTAPDFAGTENVVPGGNDEANTLTGTDLADLIQAFGGADQVNAGGGDDIVEGGTGNDVLDGQANNDRVYGEAGEDNVTGGLGDDNVYGGNDRDFVSDAGGSNLLEGNAGADILYAFGAGRDELYADTRVDLSAAIVSGEGAGTGLKGDWLMAGADDDLAVGSAGNDVVLGGGGNDILVGGAGDDNIDGDLGYVTNTYDWKAVRAVITQPDGSKLYQLTYDPAVTVDASAGGKDVIYAGSGEDWVRGGLGDDFVDAGSGADKVWGDAGSDALVGGAGNDILTGDNPGIVAAADEGGDYLDGGGGDDQLFGNGGGDILIGGAGNDVLVGGAGKDIYVFNKGDGTEVVFDTPAGASDPEASILVFGDGVKRADIKFRTGSLFVDVGDGEGIHFEGFDFIDPQNTPLIGEIRFADGTSMSYAEVLAHGFDIDGTEESDDNHDAAHPQLQGTGVTDRIRGLGGDDIILGLAGDDTIDGGEGRDSLHGQRGADVIDGGAGDDFLYGDGFYDVLGTPVLNFDDDGAADTLRGGDGNDYLNAAGGDDILEGGHGSDVLLGGTGKDTYYFNAGDGADTLIDASTGADASALVFGEGFDPSNLKVRLGSLVLDFGDAGSVTLPDFNPLDTSAPAPFDSLIFADGSTLDYAGVQALGLYIDGTPDNDLLTGTAFGDHLSGLAGSDTLRGNTGNDELNGGDGYDTLEGGAGADFYIYDTFDVINIDSQGVNRIVYGAGITPEMLTINEFFISGQSRLLIARSGALGAGLEVRGASMATTSFVHVFSDGTVLTQAQLLPIAIRDARVINGNFFDNTLTGFAGNDQLSGGFGNDTLSGMAGDDVLYGGLDNDTLLGGVGNDQLSGDDGSDVLFGDAGNDNLTGGTGNDVLSGGPGNDTLTAGPGADVHLFGYGDGNDVIGAGVNIDADLDTIRLADGISVSDVTIAHEPGGDLTLILNATGERITMTGWYTSGHSVERIEFGDGTFVDEAELPSLPVRPLAGTVGDDVLTGTHYEETVLGMAGADVLDGGRANDVLQGGEGSDTYVLGWGTGRDTVTEQTGETSTVRLAPGMTFDDVLFAQEGNDLFLHTRRAGDGLVLKDYYTQPHDWRIETASGASMTVADFLALPAATTGNAVTDLWEAQKTAVKTLWYTNTPGQVLTDGTIYAAPASAVSLSFTKNYFNGDIGAGTGGLPNPLVLGTETFSSFGAGTLISSDAASQLYQLESRTSTTVRSTAAFDIAWDALSVSRGTYYQGTFIGDDGMSHSRYLVQVTPTLRGAIEGFTPHASDGASTAQLEYAAVIGSALPFQVNAALDSVASSFNLTQVRAGGSDNVIQFNAFGMVDAGAGNDLIDSRADGYFWNVASAGNFLYGGAGDDRITGSSAQDLISGGAGDDVLAGWADNDTYYFFGADAGVDIINEATRYLWEVVNAPQDNYQSGQLSEDTIEFGEGISFSGLTFSTGLYESRSTISGETILYDTLDIFWDAGKGVRILMPDYFDPQVRSDIRSNPGRSWGVEHLQFADGSTISVQEAANAIPVQTLNGTAADETLHGGAGRDAFFGGAGYDALEGGFGDDVYYFNLGDGEDWIYDYGGSDAVVFGAGITADMLSLDSSLFAGFWGSMLVRVGASDKLHLEFFRPTEALDQGQIETYRFADGSTLTHAQLLERGFDITGTEFLDFLNGTNLDDRMFGLAGDDRLDGLGGADRMAGGSGNDTYVNVENPGDVVIENANEGIDTIESRIDYTLPDNVENLTLVGLEAIIGRGNALDNVIVDATVGSYWSNALYGEAGNDTLIGGPAGDSLFGGEGNDILDGGVGGGDQMYGGPGDDVYIVDGQGDQVFENAGEGTDTVFSSVGYGLSSTVENLTLTGTNNVGLVGGDLDNVLSGNSGNNNLFGAGGDDTMLGNAGNDFMDGGEGNDFIDGGVGSDTMFGGTGDDTFIVERTTDVVNESLNSGIDTVQSSITYALGANVENLTLTGTASINGTGNTLANVITGNSANNILDGGTGNDLLMGGEGSDSYRFNLGTGLETVEEVDAQGTDTDNVLLGYGINTANLRVARAGNDIVLTVDGASDRLTLRSWFNAPGNRIERTQFADNTVWDAAKLESLAIPSNGAPLLAVPIADQQASEDAQFLFAVPADAFADPDAGDTLTYTASRADGTALPDWLAFDPATRSFSGTPAQADVGTIELAVTVTDSGGLSAQDTFTLTIVNTNDAPVLANAIPDQAAVEDASFSFTVAADTFADYDPGDTLTISAAQVGGTASAQTSVDGDAGGMLLLPPLLPLPPPPPPSGGGSLLPSWLHFDAATRAFTGTPTNDDVGTLEIRVTATDAAGASVSDTFVINVANENDAPILEQAIADHAATEDQAFEFVVPSGTFVDVDAGDTLALSATLEHGAALPTWLQFDPATRTFSGTPANEDVGTLRVQVTATDGSTASVSDVFGITVANVNDAPVVAYGIADQIASEDSPFSFTVPEDAIVDPDVGDVLTWSASGANGEALPAWLTFDALNRALNGTPTNDDVGSFAVRVTATDSSNISASESFGITVANTNDAPTLEQPIADQSATEDQAFELALPSGTFADVDAGDTLTLSASLADGSPLPGWLTLNGSMLSGTPLNADVGAYDVKVIATDRAGESASDVFHLDVANVNDAPVVAIPLQDRSFEANATFTYTVPAGTFADEDAGDALAYSASLFGGGALPSWLTFDAATATFTGNPITGNIGISHIAVTSTDASGASAVSDFGLIVYAPADATVTGGDGDDVIYGGTGDETLVGKAGDDALFGNVGDDLLRGGTGIDVLQGEAGSDVLRGGTDNNVLDGGSGDDLIFDGSGDSFISGGTGNDTIKMSTGNDIIAFNSGDGWDTIIGGGDGGNTLSFGGGIRYSDLSLSKAGKDLIVNAGTSDGMVLKDWYAGSQSVLNLQIVLDATDEFDAASSDPLYNRRVQTFNFLGLVSAFDQARMASPGLTSWDVTNALLQWQLWGADDAALGGDLAYWYGTNRTLAGISLAAAQQVIGAAGFGSEAQSLHPFSGLQEGFVKLS